MLSSYFGCGLCFYRSLLLFNGFYIYNLIVWSKFSASHFRGFSLQDCKTAKTIFESKLHLSQRDNCWDDSTLRWKYTHRWNHSLLPVSLLVGRGLILNRVSIYCLNRSSWEKTLFAHSTTYSKSSKSRTFSWSAEAIRRRVWRVGLVFPFSMRYIFCRSISQASASADWLMPAASRLRAIFSPSLVRNASMAARKGNRRNIL